MARARGERTRVFVSLGPVNYGFAASANSNNHRGALGHTIFNQQPGVVFGANSPKPNRATKEITSINIVTSFFDPSREAALRADDWIIHGGGRRRGLARTPRSRTVFVDMGTYNYAWNLTTAEQANMEILGIEFASGSTPSLVWGSTPRPPRATRRINGRIHSTFIRPTLAIVEAAQAAGWSISDPFSTLPPE